MRVKRLMVAGVPLSVRAGTPLEPGTALRAAVLSATGHDESWHQHGPGEPLSVCDKWRLLLWDAWFLSLHEDYVIVFDREVGGHGSCS
jgi:hypothetical protein